MKIDDVFIAGLGVYLADPFPTEDAIEQGLYDQEDYEKNGLTATLIAGEISAPEMAVMAAREALARSEVDPVTVDLLLHAHIHHQGPEGWSPAAYVQQAVLDTDAPAIELQQGCNGMLIAMELATCYLRSAPGRTAALLTAADNFASPLIDRWRSAPGFLVGDAASAVLLSTQGGFARLRAAGSITISELESLHRGGEPLFPPGAVSRRKVNLRERSAFFRENKKMFVDALKQINQGLVELVDEVLADAEIKITDIARVVCVNMARYVTEQWLARPLGVPLSRTTWDFGRGIGHTGASDQIISFDHLLRTGQLRPGDHVLLTGIAAGMSIATTVVEILELPDVPTPVFAN